MFSYSSREDVICNTGGQSVYCTVMCREPLSVASWPNGTGWGDFLLVSVLHYAHFCSLLQQSLPRDSADGEHQSCVWHIRTARMWVEVISNEFCLIYGTNAFSTLHECSLSIHGAIEHSLFLFKFSFFLAFKGSQVFFAFLSTNSTISNFRSMTSYESHAGKRSHVFEASRPLHLFDQQLGCEFCRSESGSEAPWGPPFMPATSRG